MRGERWPPRSAAPARSAERRSAARPPVPRVPDAGRPLLSIVVPAWNEADRIRDCIEQLLGRLQPLDPEIVVVDDGSGDGTAEACAAWIACHPGRPVRLLRRPHRGKGAAVYAGVLATRGAVVGYIDADLDVPAEEVGRLLAVRAALGLDVIVGSKRALSLWHGTRPLGRALLSVAFSWLVRWVFRLPVRDTQTGVKLYGGAWLRGIAQHARVHGFLFDLELLGVAAAEGLRIGEEPVAVRSRRGANRLGLAAVGRCLAELARVAPSVRRIRRLRRGARRTAGAGAGTCGS